MHASDMSLLSPPCMQTYMTKYSFMMLVPQIQFDLPQEFLNNAIQQVSGLLCMYIGYQHNMCA